MNEQLQTALANLITSTLAAKDFIVAEMPDVIQQLLTWKITQYGIAILLLTILILYLVIKFKKLWGLNSVDDVNTPDEVVGVFGILSGAILVFAVQFWLINLFSLLKVWIAPKIFLIEYAAHLVK